jgi:hypothetical protein
MRPASQHGVREPDCPRVQCQKFKLWSPLPIVMIKGPAIPGGLARGWLDLDDVRAETGQYFAAVLADLVGELEDPHPVEEHGRNAQRLTRVELPAPAHLVVRPERA